VVVRSYSVDHVVASTRFESFMLYEVWPLAMA